MLIRIRLHLHCVRLVLISLFWVVAAGQAQMPDPPRKLFPWDMATIDVIVRREGDRYYAILKDERYATPEWTTGSNLRVGLPHVSFRVLAVRTHGSDERRAEPSL